jgi:hypothetical protein
MMNELKEVKKAVNPMEVLLVVDAMTGQEAAGMYLHLIYLTGVLGFISLSFQDIEFHVPNYFIASLCMSCVWLFLSILDPHNGITVSTICVCYYQTRGSINCFVEILGGVTLWNIS